MTSHSDEQKLRRETADNDRKVREQEPATMHEFAMAEANIELGRYSAMGKQNVVASRPDVAAVYPAAAAAHQVQLPIEPSFGVDIDYVEPCGTAAEIEASLRALKVPDGFSSLSPVVTGPASAAPLVNPPDVPRGAGSFSDEDGGPKNAA
jgi:hypothetical protein